MDNPPLLLTPLLVQAQPPELISLPIEPFPVCWYLRGAPAKKKEGYGMSLKRTLRLLALMVFIFVVVALLARSSIWELRARAEEGFVHGRLSELRQVAVGGQSLQDPLYLVTSQGEFRSLGKADPLPQQGAETILSFLSSTPGGFRHRDQYWVYLPLEDGKYLLSGAPYREVIAWTAGFEAREIRNAILVMVAFGILALVWMWADRRALLAAQKAQMVEELERKVQERTETLKRMNRLARLGEFSASLAHEIRNPLGTLVTAATLLPKVAGDEQKELAGVIKKESTRLDHILADFLNFSKDPRPRITMNPVHPILQRTLEGLTRGEDLKKMKITYRLDSHVKEVPCDPEQIEQVFWNIARNGAQAMGGTGELLVSTRRNECWVEVSFRDNGPGIPEEKWGQIFEPFYTEKRMGTGLGLSIASRIVEAHGGFIQVASNARSWSLFTISLPLQDEG
jgi:signal transduction histidine kinase